MKSKKKSQSKSRSNRNRAGKSDQASVETTSIESETHSSKAEFVSKEIEIPIPITDKELSIENNIKNIVEEKIPIQEQEPPSIDKKPSNGEESSNNEELTISKGDNTTSKVQETSDNTAEMPSKVLSKPSKEVEAVKASATPSASQSAIKAAPKVIEDIKHPLEHNWGFWLNTNENKKNWTENQKELTVFNTVEDYWCLYHYMKHPSELFMGQDYGVFKQGIKPMWEDPANHNGGKWLINLERKGQEVDRIWLDVVLLMIGQNFENSSIICGAVVNNKQNNKHRVSIWTRTKEEMPNMEIGRKLKGILGLNLRLQFIDHKTNHALFTI